MKCICCKKDAVYTILLASTPDAFDVPRYYIPNQHARSEPELAHITEAPFCHACIRSVDDSVRMTVLYLQSENRLFPAAG